MAPVPQENDGCAPSSTGAANDETESQGNSDCNGANGGGERVESDIPAKDKDNSDFKINRSNGSIEHADSDNAVNNQINDIYRANENLEVVVAENVENIDNQVINAKCISIICANCGSSKIVISQLNATRKYVSFPDIEGDASLELQEKQKTQTKSGNLLTSGELKLNQIMKDISELNNNFLRIGEPKLTQIIKLLQSITPGDDTSSISCSASYQSVSSAKFSSSIIYVNRVRGFLEDVANCKPPLSYQAGQIVGHENMSILKIDRVQEYKEIAMVEENSVMSKLAVFALALINARQDGTIYFGVADSKRESGRKHGEVVGTSVDKDTFTEWFATHFHGHNATQFSAKNVKAPEMIVALKTSREIFERCVKPPQFIMVESGSKENLFVIEVDVEASWQDCGDNAVCRRFGKKGEQSVQVAFRTCTSSKKEVISANNWETQFDLFQKNVEECSKTRYKHEAARTSKFACCEVQYDMEKALVPLGGKINNTDISYILITDISAEKESDWSWACQINWAFVFDFGKFHELVEMNSFKREIQKADIDSISQVTLEEAAAKLIWYQCDDLSGKDLEFKEWNRLYGKKTKKAFKLATQEKTEEQEEEEPISKDCIFLFLVDHGVSSHRLAKMRDIIRTVIGKYESPRPIVCIGTNQTAMSDLAEFQEKDDKAKRCFTIAHWDFLSAFMSLHLEGVEPKRCIPSSSGSAGIPIGPELEQYCLEKLGMTILAQNECSHLPRDRVQAELVIKDYFRCINLPSWELLHYSLEAEMKGVVKRSVLKAVVKDVQMLSKKTNGCVELMELAHSPGAGGTTTAMLALWRLREVFRCAGLDGSLFAKAQDKKPLYKTLGNAILKIRKHKENSNMVRGKSEESPPPVLILMDNANREMAEKTKEEIEKQIKGQRILTRKTQVILLYVTREIQHNSRADDRQVVKQLLEDDEEGRFKDRLSGYGPAKAPKSILEFALAQEACDDYLERVTKSYIKDPKENQLLLYLAVLAYLGNENLGIPVECCTAIPFAKDKRSSITNEKTCELFSAQSQMQHGTSECPILKIIHPRVAKIIFQSFMKGPDLVSEIGKMLRHLMDISEACEKKEEMKGIFIQLFTQPVEFGQAHFPALSKIVAETGNAVAARLFLKAVDVLKSPEPVVVLAAMTYVKLKQYQTAKGIISEATKQSRKLTPQYRLVLALILKIKLCSKATEFKDTSYDLANISPLARILAEARKHIAEAKKSFESESNLVDWGVCTLTEIEMHNTMLSVFFSSESLKNRTESIVASLKHITLSEQKEDLVISWLYNKQLLDIYPYMKFVISKGSRKLAHFDEFSNNFKTFGNDFLKHFLNPSEPGWWNIDNIQVLEDYLTPLVVRSFPSLLEEKRDRLKIFHEIQKRILDMKSKRKETLSQENHYCWVSVLIAIHAFEPKYISHYDVKQALEHAIAKTLTGIYQNEVNLFYVAMNWPFQRTNGLYPGDENIFHGCLSHLEDCYKDCDFASAKPIFMLSVLGRIQVFDDWKQHMDLQDGSSVDGRFIAYHPPAFDRPFRIPCERPCEKSERIRFKVKITLFGPVAFDMR